MEQDARIFTVQWMNEPSPDGVRPNSTLIPIQETTKTSEVPIGTIISNRQPYSIQHLYTKYGELSTRLGTNLGAN